MRSILTPLTFVLAAGLVAWLYPRFLSVDEDAPKEMRRRELPQLFRAFKKQAAGESYAGVIVSTGVGETSEAPYIQFSLEQSRIGLDWLLNTRQGIADADRFSSLAKSLGQPVLEREQNGVKYLRVEQGDLLALAEAVLADLYDVKQSDLLRLQTSGIEWSEATRD